ncbi:MAG: PilZ domain-containing protein [Nitrospiraceae bacterium]|jgi:c-di-GMP-binding flagellar brake protein YcgR|nr:PilZ domain-containing protein [Nitrospiraceae bacterium]
MSYEYRRSHRVSVTDWAEVLSYPEEYLLGIGHLKDISESGMAMVLPMRLQPGVRVQVRVSTISCGRLRHFEFTGSVVRADLREQGCMHGVQFFQMTQNERLSMMDYLCEVDHHYPAAS